MKNLKLIIQREFNSKVRNKSFLIMTLLSPFILVGMIFLIAYLSGLNNEQVRTVAVLDQSGQLAEALEDSKNLVFENLLGIGLEEAKAISRESVHHGLLFIPSANSTDELDRNIQFFSDESPSISVIQYMEKSLSSKITNLKLIENGVDVSRLEASTSDVDIKIENYKGEQTSKMASIFKIIFGGGMGYLLMMFIIIYGNMVMRSVIEEKVNRIIEIIISSVKPFELMMGKIIGTTMVGLAQFLIWVVLGSVLLFAATAIFGLETGSTSMAANPQLVESGTENMQAIVNDILSLPLVTLTISFIAFFIGGYFLYSSIYAAIGAAVDNETDTQQFMFPIIMPLMLAMYIGAFAVFENPHGTVAVVFSYIPLTSPIVMLMRIPFGVAWWEILISVLILFVTFALVVWLAAKIYRVGILMYGKKPTYKELYKWLKY